MQFVRSDHMRVPMIYHRRDLRRDLSTRHDQDGSLAARTVLYPWRQVMSISVKPRLADRQPSNRGGVLRVMTGLRDEVLVPRQARVRRSDPNRVELHPADRRK